MSAIATPVHRVSRAVAGMRATCDDLAEVALWSMAGGEAAATLVELVRLEAQVAELKLRTLARVSEAGVPDRAGATSTANWYAHHTKLTRAQAHRETRLATALADHHPARRALAAGRLHVDQARVVVEAVDQLPAGTDVELVEDAELHLVAEAVDHDAKGLRRLGRHLVEVVDPEGADAHTATLLEREERRAAATTRLTMWDDGQGRVHGRFTLPALEGAMLKKALLALAAPRHRAAHGPLGERRPGPERLGQAFADYVSRYPADRLPAAGGVAATVVVTMTLDALLEGLTPARLDTGEAISAALARRLACEAGIIPAVLGRRSQVLDLGRRARFHTPAQRIALAVEQRDCTAQGCDYPPSLCHTHHDTPWHAGGTTTTRDARLLCPRHHARAHDPAFTTTTLPSGKVAFTRRT